MIITASRRTDIPAFYSEWFMQRIREGYCTVFNPFNRHQVSRVSLLPRDVEVIVFFTKNARPLFQHLKELEERGLKYYFHYTLNGYSREFEPHVPSLEKSLDTFSQLASVMGPEKLIWRYDPIVISNQTGYDYHIRQFEKIARNLRGKTQRVVISWVDEYRKAVKNFKRMEQQNIFITPLHRVMSEPRSSLGGGPRNTVTEELVHGFGDFVRTLVQIADENELQLQSCAETLDIECYGLLPGKCIDDHFIETTFGRTVTHLKHKSQRPECGCVESKDIGVYDTCLHGCSYCYAGTLSSGQKNWALHDPASSSLIGPIE